MLFTARPSSARTFNPRSCHFTAATYVVFAAMGGESTGKFRRDHKPGRGESPLRRVGAEA